MRPMIRKILIKKDLESINTCIISFDDDLVVITGDNGVGKTELLNLIMSCYPESIDDDVDIECENAEERSVARFLDCTDIYSLDKSPGEDTIEALEGLLTLKDRIIIIDNPESNLSIRGQVEMVDIINVLKTENQVFVATNSIPLLKAVEDVYSMDVMGWVKSKDYIKENLLSNVRASGNTIEKFDYVNGEINDIAREI